MANAIKVIRKIIKKVSDKEAKEIAQQAAGAKGNRLVKMVNTDKYGKPIKGPSPITDNAKPKTVKVKPSEKLTGRPAGESKVVKPKVDIAKKMFKDYGGGSVSPGQRAALKEAMDKGLKPDAKIVEAKISKTERVRPPKDKPRVYKKVIKKVEKAKPATTPKPRKDKPIQGPAKIKRPRPTIGSPGVKKAEDDSNPRLSTEGILEKVGRLSDKEIATYKEFSKIDENLAHKYAESIANKKPPITNKPVKKIIRENPTRPSTLAEQQRQRLITKTKEKRLAKQRTRTVKSSRAKQNELARIRRKQKEFEASQKRNN